MSHPKNPWIDKLHQHELYKLALEMARDDDERRKIASLAESFVIGFSEVVPTVINDAHAEVQRNDDTNRAKIVNDSVITDNGQSAPRTVTTTDE